MKRLLLGVAVAAAAQQDTNLSSTDIFVNSSNQSELSLNGTNITKATDFLDPDQPNRKSNPNIRLASNEDNPWGRHCADGRVELLRDDDGATESTWGTICSTGWTQTDTDVVCSMLGFSYGVSVWPYYKETTKSLYGPGFQNIWLSNVKCDGDELYVGQCSAEKFGTFNCTHDTEVGVICSDYKLNNASVDNNKCAKRDARASQIIGSENSTYYFYGKEREKDAGGALQPN